MHVVHQRRWVSSRAIRCERTTGRMPVAHPPRQTDRVKRKAYGVTVMEPFMFIAACGVQMKSYLPAGTLANEIV